jgi:putative membrane protein
MVAWTLVFHIMGLVFWVGSLLVVTHILAVHTDETSPEIRATLGRLETRLFKGLTHPGAALMVITGTLLVAQDPEYLREHWLHAKLLLVLVLIVLDLRLYLRTVAFQAGKIELTRGECMTMHGAIALVFSCILILVLLKPFGLPQRRTQLMAPGRPGGSAAWRTPAARPAGCPPPLMRASCNPKGKRLSNKQS